MPGAKPPGLVASAALAIAQGQSPAAFAKKNAISARTVQRWAKRPAFIAHVEEIRARMLDGAIGIMVSGASDAATRLRLLVAKSQNEQVQLSAARALLADLLSVQSHAELKRELREIRARLDRQEQAKGGARAERSK